MTTYVTMKLPPSYHQMTLEEFLYGTDIEPRVINPKGASTRTYKTENINSKLQDKVNVPELIWKLQIFNDTTKQIRAKPRSELYETFYVAKRNKGMPYLFRRIFAAGKLRERQDGSEMMRFVGSRMRGFLGKHPTTEDKKLIDKVAAQCVDYLKRNGFEMTDEQFKAAISESYRRIDAPNDELKAALNTLKGIFEDDFHALYHTSAFAYIKHRSTVDAVKRHQQNESKWFGKYDLKNFFGSTTVDFISKMFAMVFPFSEVMKSRTGREELEKALSLCTLYNTLPQGTPISPLLTNIMMIPIDHELSNKLRDYALQKFIYTRYADDFLVSSKYNFDVRVIEEFITTTLSDFEAPFTINTSKTRYGSSAGSNWNLGVMLNKDNQITVGYKKKRKFQAMLSSYILDRQNGHLWDKSDVQIMEGYRNYYRMVEGETIDRITDHIGKKFGVDVVRCIKEDLKK